MSIDDFVKAVREADLQGEKEVLVKVEDLAMIVSFYQTLDNQVNKLTNLIEIKDATIEVLKVKMGNKLDDYV